jgi:hypothetical protein
VGTAGRGEDHPKEQSSALVAHPAEWIVGPCQLYWTSTPAHCHPARMTTVACGRGTEIAKPLRRPSGDERDDRLTR